MGMEPGGLDGSGVEAASAAAAPRLRRLRSPRFWRAVVGMGAALLLAWLALQGPDGIAWGRNARGCPCLMLFDRGFCLP